MDNNPKKKELNREGHRKRLRNTYYVSGADAFPDHNLLELFITTVISRKDVKPLAYALISKFGSLEGVLTASPKELCEIDGIGEETALAISLIKPIAERGLLEQRSKRKTLKSYSEFCDYCYDFFKFETNEKLLMITLDNGNHIKNRHTFSSGNSNEISVPIAQLVRAVTIDGASSVLLAHNHPGCSCQPSASDISYTIELNSVLKKLGIYLLDHIVFGEDGCNSIKKYANFE